jgi:general stress protein 26
MSGCLDAIYFLTDVRRHKDEKIARNPNINLSFADTGDQKYVSVAGTRPDLGNNRKVAL